MGGVLIERSGVKSVLFLLLTMAPKVKAAKPKVVQVSSKTPEERKAAFKKRKTLKKRLARKQLANALARLPEVVAERKRARKEYREKKAALHRKISQHKKKYYATIKANPSLRKAKAKNAKRSEAIKAERKKLEDLAGMKFK